MPRALQVNICQKRKYENVHSDRYANIDIEILATSKIIPILTAFISDFRSAQPSIGVIDRLQILHVWNTQPVQRAQRNFAK